MAATSSPSLKIPSSQVSLHVHWRLQVSSSLLYMLKIGAGLASKLFVMSQIELVGPPLKIRFSMSKNKIALSR